MSHGRQPRGRILFSFFGAFLLLTTDGKRSCWMSVAWHYNRDDVNTLQKGKKLTYGCCPWLMNVCASAPYYHIKTNWLTKQSMQIANQTNCSSDVDGKFCKVRALRAGSHW